LFSELLAQTIFGTIMFLSVVVAIIAFYCKIYFHFKLLRFRNDALREYSFLTFILFPFLFIKHLWIIYPVYFRNNERQENQEIILEKKIINSLKIFWVFFLLLILATLIFDLLKNR